MLQAVTPEPVRGRIFALMDVLWQGGRLLSIAVGGVLADRYGIEAVYYLGGALLVAAAAAGLLTRSTPARSSGHPRCGGGAPSERGLA